jgi:hypothetical protein
VAFQLAPEMREIDAMLGEKLRADENYRYVVVVALEEDGIIVNIHFTERGACGSKDGGHSGFGFFAKMTALAHVHGDVSRACEGQAARFGAGVKISARAGAEKSLADEIADSIENCFACSRSVASDKFEKRMQIEGRAIELIEGGENAESHWFHGNFPMVREISARAKD